MKKTITILGKRGRITIPYELWQQVGFQENDVLSFTLSEDGSAVTVRREKLSGGDLAKSNISALTNFLDGLSPEKQREALIHLSLKWAEQQGGQNHG